jgi:hypothetical protein
VTPGSSYAYVCGPGGTGVASSTGNPGTDSTFNSTSIVADGGAGGVPSTGTPPSGVAGGLVANCTGVTKLAGGFSAAGRNNAAGIGGHGGSSAGPLAAGVPTSAAAYAQNYPGGNPADSGVGGNGGAEGANGGTGGTPGGGGGGSGDGTAKVGGTGGAGQIRVTYAWPTLSLLGI